MSGLEDRIIELEQRVSFQDDLVHKLDDALGRQQKQLLDLEHRLSLLMEHVRKLESSGGAASPPEDEKPPHY